MKIDKKLVKYIEDNCKADEFTGNLKCNKCGRNVIVDWFEMSITCNGCDEL